MAPVSQAPRRYLIELALAFTLYGTALIGRLFALKFVHDPALMTAITLLPIVPILLMALAAFRFYRHLDEYHRLRLLKIMAIAGGLTAVAAAAWNFLQDVGAPQLTNFGVVFIFAGVFSWVAFLYRVEDAASEGKIGKIGRGVSWTGALVMAGAGFWLATAYLLGWPWTAPLAAFVAGAVVVVFVSLYIGPSASLV